MDLMNYEARKFACAGQSIFYTLIMGIYTPYKTIDVPLSVVKLQIVKQNCKCRVLPIAFFWMAKYFYSTISDPLI